MRKAIVVGAVSLLAILALPACHETAWDCENDLLVINDSHCDLTIVVDGHQAFVIHDHDTRRLEDIGSGEHVLEALDTGGQAVELRRIDLHSCEDYYWRIQDC